jgi:uncharacterized caspase-like protein
VVEGQHLGLLADGVGESRCAPRFFLVPGERRACAPHWRIRFDQASKEDDTLGHGLFTYAVVEGLEGKGGIAARRKISTKELADYVIKRVEQLAKDQNASQEPANIVSVCPTKRPSSAPLKSYAIKSEKCLLTMRKALVGAKL